ncbi:sensor histidine kinase [Micrococcus luteus]|uniref:sensor histidine kinase n=1 Tax=Micrococcus luteus TaxID=1270 RepID=UPI00119ACDD4|nr:sensor histidine kinase [Micrococcus luteus]TWH34298.1 signal transduction histidine kinase [Micrococcus luteus J28]
MSVAPRAAAPTETGTTAVLAGLRVALHVTFAALLTVGLARALADRSPEASSGPFPATTLVLLTAALAGVYLAGTVLERRRWARGDDVGRGPAVAWLALVLLLWGLLVAHHGDFAWVAFPLFFVVLHVVDRVARQAWVRHVVGPALVVAMAVVVVAGMAAGAGGVRVPAVIGPLVGAAVAVVLSGAYRALHAESERQRAVAEQLRAAQAELARTEHRAGVSAERERLAREIHDTLTQGLASIVLVSRAAQDALDAADPALARQRMETVRATAAENLAESRRFVRDLRGTGAPSLIEALERAVTGFADRQAAAGTPPDEISERVMEVAAAGTPVAADVEVVGEPVAVAEAVETAVLRAVQASLANVGAHAGAHRARVTLGYLGDELTVDVADDGAGFDPAVVAARARAGAAGADPGVGTGVGLASVRERLAAVGGEATVESAPGEGTVVALRVPLAAAGAGRSADPEQTESEETA